MEDPWSIQSLFELQFFVCPSCAYKNNSKQEFVYHAYNIHPESIEKLKIINDDSISDVNCPWNEILEIKEETQFELNNIEDNSENVEMLVILKEDHDEILDDFQDENSSIQKSVEELVCNLCGKTFNSKQYVKRHKLAIHDGVSRYKCEFCKKAYKQSWDLKKHRHKKHQKDLLANQDKYQKCEYCGKEYLKKNMSLHIKDHTMHKI